MWTEIIRWWQTLWTDPTIIGGAIAGFISALVMFLFGDVIWKSRMERVKAKAEFRQKQLDCFYAPLYRFYREAYARFDAWHKANTDTQLARQPFFDGGDDEIFVENILAEHPGYASQLLLRQWAAYMATADKTERHNRRQVFIATLIKEYHALRRKLDLDYDKEELKTGVFSKTM